MRPASLPRYAALFAVVMLGGCATPAPPPPAPPGLDAEIQRLMTAARVPGVQLALIQDGKVTYSHAYGYANVDKQQALRTDTIMYAASLTKAVFAYTVMQLVDEGVLTLDAPLPTLLKKSLPDYPKFADLKDDPRWQLLTPRMLLSHTSGLINWRYINENNKLDFKYPPGSRYVYSGEGLNILQIVVEERTGGAAGHADAAARVRPLWHARHQHGLARQLGRPRNHALRQGRHGHSTQAPQRSARRRLHGHDG